VACPLVREEALVREEDLVMPQATVVPDAFVGDNTLVDNGLGRVQVGAGRGGMRFCGLDVGARFMRAQVDVAAHLVVVHGAQEEERGLRLPRRQRR
jgi:hypothetical protein